MSGVKSMDLVLDLNNFNTPDAEGSRYVLTSPRSLEACARMKVRPVHLLPKPLEDFIEENPGKPLPLLQVFHDNHELKRVELLQKCRDARQIIIMENKVEEKRKMDEICDGKEKTKNGVIATRTKTTPRQSPGKTQPKEKLIISKSLSKAAQDVNNNAVNAEYDVIPTLNDNSPRDPKRMIKQSITPRQFGQPLTPGRATFTKSKTKVEAEEPYMLSTPVAPKKLSESQASTRSLGRMGRRSGATGDPCSRSLMDRSLTDRKRSLSVDAWKRKPHFDSSVELASSLKFANSSGYSTPQQQKDQKIVEMMKDKRKQQELDARRVGDKQREWEEEKRKEEKRKHQQHLVKERSLRQSQLDWEKRMKEKEERRVREMRRSEVEKQMIIEETEKQIERKKKEQERMQWALLEERRKSESLKKQLQQNAKQSVENEIKEFQEATERELEEKLEKAQKTKLEKEMKEINKLQFLNKSQRERFLRLEKELKKRKIEEEGQKRTHLQEKMEKADILRTRKISDRDLTLKQLAKQEEQKIQKTKEKQDELARKNDEYLQSIAAQKKEQLKKANSTFLHNVQTKSKRAQQLRETSQDEQKRRMKKIEEEEEKHLMETKEYLDAKDTRSKTHQQLKEAAIQLSRANARAAEGARLEVKQKDDTFLEANKQAALISSIGRGPRTGLVNASSVKFG